MTTTRTSCQRISSNASSRSPICVFKSQDICTGPRSEEHTSELQSRLHLVCRLLLEKKNRRNFLLAALLRDVRSGVPAPGLGFGPNHMRQTREPSRHPPEGRVRKDGDVPDTRPGAPA